MIEGMILRFCTRRNTNGNRRYAIIDTANKQYSTESARRFHRDDFIEVSTADWRKIIIECVGYGYNMVDCL